ncbi:MAG: FecR domain-containing protein [Planctomycetota bacterium]
MIGLLVAPEGRTWEGLELRGEGPVVVDGRELSPRDLSRLGAEFGEATRFESRENLLRLSWGDDLVLQIQPRSEVELLAQSEGGLRLGLSEGEVFLKSRAGYEGPPVRVVTADATMRMTGTVVGVMAVDRLTCVCVARGEVEVLDHHNPGGGGVCHQDARHVVFSDGRTKKETFADEDSEHARALREFADVPGKLGF